MAGHGLAGFRGDENLQIFRPQPAAHGLKEGVGHDRQEAAYSGFGEDGMASLDATFIGAFFNRDAGIGRLAYFLPDGGFREALKERVAIGIEWKIMVLIA